MTNHVDKTRPFEVNESRRDFLKKAAVFAATTTTTASLASQVLAESVQPEKPLFELIPSQLGLDSEYRRLEETDSPIGALFSFAEQEWMKNALDVFGEEDTKAAWKDSLFPRLETGELSNYDIADLREFCPEFLSKCAVAIDPNHERYSSLMVEGSILVGERL